MVVGFVATPRPAWKIIKPRAIHADPGGALMLRIAGLRTIAVKRIAARCRSGDVRRASNAGIELLAASTTTQSGYANPRLANPTSTRAGVGALQAAAAAAHANARAVRIRRTCQAGAEPRIAGFPAAGIRRTNRPRRQSTKTFLGTVGSRAPSAKACRRVARFGAVAEYMVVAKLKRISHIAAGVEDARVRRAEFSVVAVGIGKTFDTTVGHVAAIRRWTRACSAAAAVFVNQTGLARRRSSVATLACHRSSRHASMRGFVAGLATVAVKPVVAIAGVFAFHAQLEGVAAKLPRRAGNRST